MNSEVSRTAPRTAGSATLACLGLALLLGAFHHDTLRFGADSLGHYIMAFTPVTDNPDWFEVPERPWLLVKSVTVPTTPGETTRCDLQVMQEFAPRDRTGDTLMVYARGADSIAIDSVALLFRW